jgi:hypothetical protein
VISRAFAFVAENAAASMANMVRPERIRPK